MIVFGYAKDIAPIDFILIYLRLHPKAGPKQHRDSC